jgi:hypothetical protein
MSASHQHEPHETVSTVSPIITSGFEVADPPADGVRMRQTC